MNARLPLSLLVPVLMILSLCPASPVRADDKGSTGEKSAKPEPTRDGRTLEEWIAALKERDTRDKAIKELGGFGAAAVPALIREATAKNSYYRPDAIEALAEVGAPGIEAMINAVKAQPAAQPAVQYALAKTGRPAVPALIELLKQKDEFLRAFAAITLGRMGPPAEDAVPVLVELINIKESKENNQKKGGGYSGGTVVTISPMVGGTYVAALGGIGPKAKSAVPTLIEAAKEPVPMRLIAIDAIAGVGPEAAAAVPLLIGFLEDKDFPVRMQAARALAKIGPPAAKQAVPALISRYKKEPLEEWRDPIGDALKKIDAEAAAQAGIK
jgi:HEAT repeat protein